MPGLLSFASDFEDLLLIGLKPDVELLRNGKGGGGDVDVGKCTVGDLGFL